VRRQRGWANQYYQRERNHEVGFMIRVRTLIGGGEMKSEGRRGVMVGGLFKLQGASLAGDVSLEDFGAYPV
jgi:hypothetical protein